MKKKLSAVVIPNILQIRGHILQVVTISMGRNKGNKTPKKSPAAVCPICKGSSQARDWVRCDGPCKQWFHCSCVCVDIVDVKDIIWLC